jgi:hypothetical protein
MLASRLVFKFIDTHATADKAASAISRGHALAIVGNQVWVKPTTVNIPLALATTTAIRMHSVRR